MLWLLDTNGSQGGKAKSLRCVLQELGVKARGDGINGALTQERRVLGSCSSVEQPTVTFFLDGPRAMGMGLVASDGKRAENRWGGSETSRLRAVAAMHAHVKTHVFKAKVPISKLRAGLLSGELLDQEGEGSPGPGRVGVLDGNSGAQEPSLMEAGNTSPVNSIGGFHTRSFGGLKMRQT